MTSAEPLTVGMAVEIATDAGQVRAGLPGALEVWLRPTGVEARADGEIAVVTAEDPVRLLDSDDDRLVTEIREGDAAVTTTWAVEPRADRTTVVVAHTSEFTDPAVAEAHRERLTTVLTALAAQLEHLGDAPVTELHAWGPSRGRTRASSHEQAHARFLSQLGVIAPRQEFSTFRGVPAMAGTCLERRAGHLHSAALILLDSPALGVATFSTAGATPVHEVRAVVVGAADVVARVQAQWSAWLAAN